MAPPKDSGIGRPTLDSDVDFAGYDPYIVALTGGGPASVSKATAGAPSRAPESRKVQLMTWLREHRA